MKKVYYSNLLVRINRKEWLPLHWDNSFHYMEEEEMIKESFIISIEDFEKLWNFAKEKDWIFNRVSFLKKRFIFVDSIRTCDNDTKIFERDFVSFEFKKAFREANKNLGIAFLADKLPADEFCEYLKDRGISTCPLQNIRM